MKIFKTMSGLILALILLSFLCVSGWAGSIDKTEEPDVIKLYMTPKKVDNPPKYYRNLHLTISGQKDSGSALFTASLVSLAALNVADYLSTCKALKYPGLREGNPLLKNITKNALVFAGVKLGVAVCDYLLLKKIYKKNKTLGWVLSTAANVAMSYVVANNMKMINRAQRGL